MFFGPIGSGKSSLIGSLFRAINEASSFPERVQKTLRSYLDSHGTQNWLETPGNPSQTIIYQDTRGDTVSLLLLLLIIHTHTHSLSLSQDYSVQERMRHDFSLRGMFRDEATMRETPIYKKEWWTSQRCVCMCVHVHYILC